MANITRKQLVNVLCAIGKTEQGNTIIAKELNATPEQVNAAIDKLIVANNRPHKSKPSAETLRNRAIAQELAAEVNARNAEFTAADIAEFYTDPDGMPLTARKVGALLKQAAAMGLIDVSPEKWSVKHYGPVGFEFAKKPERKRKAKTDDAESVEDAA